MKNIADINGKPLIAYTIAAAKATSMLSNCIVSTDCEQVASIARTYGADVPFIRPDELATDSAKSIDVVLHALEFMEDREKVDFEAVVLLQPTTPLRTAAWIDVATRQLFENDFDSVISVVEVGANHPFRMYEMGSDGELLPFVDALDDPMMPRQKLPRVFLRSGDIYVTRRRCLLELKSLIGRRPGAFVVPHELSVNIDEPEDLELARMKLSIHQDV